ncbi:MFS transporter [Reinekea blandensis]|nr:MFS transporter [Reinekea blandensis]
MHSKSATFYITLILTISLSVIAIDSIIPAIPSMTLAFQTDPGLSQLTIGLYLAGYALGQIPMGLLSDRFGRRPVFLIGMTGFTLLSVATVFADTISQLLVIRFVQGVAGTVGPVVARAVARDTHHGKDLDKLMAILVTSLAAGAMIAPILGTLIVSLFGWKAPLILNAVIGGLCLILLLTSLPESHRPNRDLHPWVQTKQSALAFFTNRQALVASFVVSFTFFAYFSIATGLGSILVDYYHYPAHVVGWGFALAVTFYMVSAQVCRFRIHRQSAEKLMHQGSLFYLLAVVVAALLIVTLLLGAQLSVVALYGLLLLFLVGMGHVFAPASAVTMQPLGHIAGFAASMLGTLQMGLGTLGASLTAVFYDQTPISLIGVLMLGALFSAILIRTHYRS